MGFSAHTFGRFTKSDNIGAEHIHIEYTMRWVRRTGDLVLLSHGSKRSLSSWSGCGRTHQNMIKLPDEAFLDFLGPHVPHRIQMLLKNKLPFPPDAGNDQGAPAEMSINKHKSSSTRREPGDRGSAGIEGPSSLQAVDGGGMGKRV